MSVIVGVLQRQQDMIQLNGHQDLETALHCADTGTDSGYRHTPAWRYPFAALNSAAEVVNQILTHQVFREIAPGLGAIVGADTGQINCILWGI